MESPDVPFPSIKAIDPRDQATWNDFVGARAVEEDPATIRGARDEQRYRDAFTKDMNISRIDAVIFPSSTQLPPINGAPLGGGCCLTFVGSSLQWPELSVPSGYLGDGLPQGLEILGGEAKITGYGYAYEQATHHRRPPPIVPPLAESLANRFIGTCVPKQIWRHFAASIVGGRQWAAELDFA